MAAPFMSCCFAGAATKTCPSSISLRTSATRDTLVASPLMVAQHENDQNGMKRPQTFLTSFWPRTTKVRSILYRNTALSVAGSVGLVVADVQRFSRFTGLFSVIGSVTARYQLGISSGAYQVSSSFVVNSGGSSFDFLNPGGVAADFSLTAANSQIFAVGILAEPLR